MGLGLYIKVPSASLGKRSIDVLKEGISDFAYHDPSDSLLNGLVRCGASSDRLYVRLHPAEEDVEFFLDPNGNLVCSAKTSTAGPGYHAFLVDWLHRLGEAVQLKWDWQSGEGEGDETGYHEHRDFGRLQGEMANWLGGLSKTLQESSWDGMENIMLGLPLGFEVPDVNAFAISALGCWPRSWFEEMISADAGRRREMAQAFFPWWGQQQDALFWDRLGRVLAWVEVPWHVPANDRERAVCQSTLDCFARAKELDSAIPSPDQEFGELRGFLSEDAQRSPPRPDGIGFRRQVSARVLTGGWTVRVPGYYYDELENDGETQVYWFKGRTVRGSSITVTGKDGRRVPATKLVENPPKGATSFSKDRFAGWASIKHVEEKGEGSYWMLQGRMAASNNVCQLTICYDDKTDEEWALKTWQSIRKPPEKDEG
jgi:hypothetical protein